MDRLKTFTVAIILIIVFTLSFSTIAQAYSNIIIFKYELDEVTDTSITISWQWGYSLSYYTAYIKDPSEVEEYFRIGGPEGGGKGTYTFTGLTKVKPIKYVCEVGQASPKINTMLKR